MSSGKNDRLSPEDQEPEEHGPEESSPAKPNPNPKPKRHESGREDDSSDGPLSSGKEPPNTDAEYRPDYYDPGPMRAGTADVKALLARLSEQRPRVIDLGLGRMLRALARLGDPHLSVPPVIHIAGTNGKGSTLSFMHSVLQEAGLRVHAYTSPHLVTFNERIMLQGAPIGDARLAQVLGSCEIAAGDEPLTYFEAVTAAAFLAFAQMPADVLLLEVGLGGRLDATNVIDSPLASVITSVALDHQHFLGDTLAEIATEKAGIIKQSRPVIIGKQTAPVQHILERRALALGARSFSYSQEWHIRQEAGRLVYEDEAGLCDLAAPRMAGLHQFDNAGLAVATLKAAGIAPDDETISRGLEASRWPARLQRLVAGPLVDQAARLAGEPVEIWLDGGHNPHAARAIARSMADIDDRVPRSLILIVAMQNTKDAHPFFEAFNGMASAAFTLAGPSSAAQSAGALAQSAQSAGIPATAQTSIEAALNAALANHSDGVPRLLICGSLYLAGEILAHNK